MENSSIQGTVDLLDEENNVDLSKARKFLYQLLSVTVVVEKLPDSIVQKYTSRRTVQLSNQSSIYPVSSRQEDQNHISKKLVTSGDCTVDLHDVLKTSELFSGVGAARNEKSRQTEISSTLFICERCQKSFGKKQSLKNHMIGCKSDSTNRPFKIRKRLSGSRVETIRYCPTCIKFVEHDKDRPVHKVQTCTICNTSLELHCMKCSKKYFSYTTMMSHLNYQDCSISQETSDSSSSTFNKTNGQPIKNLSSRYCPKCDKSAKYDETVSVAKEHDCTSCTSKLLWKCGICDKQCNSYDIVRWHLINECQFTSNVPAHYNSRRKRIISVKTMTKMYCCKCDAIFSNDKFINLHLKKKCSKCKMAMQLRCIKCGKLYYSRSAMYKHLKKFCYVESGHDGSSCDYDN